MDTKTNPAQAAIIILAPETKTMRIPTKTITLDVETSMTSAGLAILAEQLRALGAQHESLAHGATLASIADALVPALARREAKDEQAREHEALRVERMRDQDARNMFMVAAGRAFRLTYTAKGEDARVPTSREMATAVKAAGYRCDRVKWNGQTWIVVPSHWRPECLAAEALHNERTRDAA